MLTTLLSGATAREGIRQLVAAIKMPHVTTPVLDGWSNINMESVWAFIAVIPKLGAVILKTVDGSYNSHTGEWISGKRCLCLCLSYWVFAVVAPV